MVSYVLYEIERKIVKRDWR